MALSIRSLLLLSLSLAFLIPSPNATAQNGRLIEGLFRTLAETQLEKERAKRIEAEKRALEQQHEHEHAKPSKDPYEVKLPSGFNSPTPRTPNARAVPRPNVPPPAARGSISVRSREAAAYAKSLVSFNNSMEPLVAELRRGAAKNPAIRPLLPEVYSIAADGRALLQRCDGISSLAPIIEPYGSLDARWRQLSFSLSALNGLSDTCTSAIKQCDQYCSSMCQQLKIEPQFDRAQLGQVMLVGATYMQAIMDDLQVSRIPQDHCHKLTHDCRLLRQRLLAAAHNVDDIRYDEIVSSFNEFVAQWGAFSQQIYALNDPHLRRRLDRISECGDQTYAILWMSPPAAFHDVTGVCQRLESNLGSISDQITLRAIAHLPPQEQINFVNSTRTLVNQAKNLRAAAARNADQNELRKMFASFDQGWVGIQSQYGQVNSLNRGVLQEIDRGCDELRVALRINGAASANTAADRLISAAASVEGVAEYMYKDIRRLGRTLEPNSFRDSVTNAAKEFSHHAEELHEQLSRPGRLSDPRYLERAQRETEHMIEGYNQLLKDFDHIEDHGLAFQKAEQLRHYLAKITPSIAQIAAYLFEE